MTGILLLLLQDLALGLLRVGNLRDRLVGVEAFITRLILVTTALEAPDEGSCAVILLILTLASIRGGGLVFFLRFFNDRLCLLGLGVGFGGLGFRRGSSRSVLLLRLLGGRLLLLRGLGLSNLRLGLTVLVVAQEIGCALARLDLSGGLAIGLGLRSAIGLCSRLFLVGLLEDRLGGVLGGFGSLGLDLLGLLCGRIGGSGSGS